MGIAVLLFSLVVGVFHFQVQETDPGVHQALAVAPAQPGNYSESGGVKTQPAVAQTVAIAVGEETFASQRVPVSPWQPS
jgi:hypothetical protein